MAFDLRTTIDFADLALLASADGHAVGRSWFASRPMRPPYDLPEIGEIDSVVSLALRGSRVRSSLAPRSISPISLAGVGRIDSRLASIRAVTRSFGVRFASEAAAA
ncbi:MAG TPA: hypothetical protein VH143_24140 [Kofleriaceae bacterium]|nr:hypothetical protein [Kofleriaceae bacterium]